MPLDRLEVPTFQLVTKAGMVARGTKLFAFGREVPGLLGVEARTVIHGPDDAIETILIIRMMGTQVLVESVDAASAAENN
jgi:hypothetical protein